MARSKEDLLARERERADAKRKAPPHAEFAARLNKVADLHPTLPPLQYGRLPWVERELQTRFNIKTTREGIRKWFAGITFPHRNTVRALAELFEVDEVWLLTGTDNDLAPRAKKLRNAQADGAVNLIAGIIQMDGGAVSFPQDDDKPHVDLYAIIRGAQYAIHVAMATEVDNGFRFYIPTGLENVLVIGVIRIIGASFDLVEIPVEDLPAAKRAASSVTVDVTRTKTRYAVGDVALKPIKTFANRL